MVIPERANPSLLKECLGSVVAACRQTPEPSEVIVVVNGWPRALYVDLARAHDSCRWIFSDKPLWYAGAVREGLRAARYDWVYLLNNDTIVDPRAFCSPLGWRSPSIFAIASQVYFRDPQKRREETGWTMFRNTDGPVEILDEIAADEITVRGTLYAGGGAALFQKRVLLELMQDSSVYSPFYWEDVEWGARAWRRGYRSLYYPTSKAWHGHRTTNRMFFPECEIDRILNRNRFIFYLRNGAVPGSFEELWRVLVKLDARSLAEILQPRRVFQILRGQFQNCLLPLGDTPLEETWLQEYGVVEELVSKNTATQS